MNDEVDRIRVYRHCPRCAGAHIRIEPPRVDCSDCGLSIYVNAAGAVAAILVDAADQVLLIRRAREPARGKLGFPGGFVDAGETAEAALCREVAEEVGLRIDTLQFLCSSTNRYPFGGVVYSTLDLFFVAKVESFSGARALDEVDALKTLAVSELRPEELSFDSMRVAWAAFLAGRARGIHREPTRAL